MSALGWFILAIFVIAVLIALAAWWYERATNEVALLRTGIGGRRVVIDGGVLAVPYFHEISKVNMQTLRLDVSRRGEEALITQDRLRVDVGAEFYVSVVPEQNAITRAAQTLGKRTFLREELRSLIEGMLVDALRSVAARLTMDELHENRANFVAEVRSGLSETLARYGLQIDSVSLTALDQTVYSSLDENNAFNAVGMRKLAEVIAKSKKERAEIDADSEVYVRRASMEASKKRLEIDLEERKAEIAQQKAIETLAAGQIAEISRDKAESQRASTQAKIEMERAIQEAEVHREQQLALAEQDRQIAVFLKSKEESLARADADKARSQAVLASEELETVKAIAQEKRRAEISKIATEAEASRKAARDLILAKSDVETAKNKATARKEEGNERSPVGNAMDSIMDMAVQMPLLKKIGDQMGVSFDDIIDDKEPPKK